MMFAGDKQADRTKPNSRETGGNDHEPKEAGLSFPLDPAVRSYPSERPRVVQAPKAESRNDQTEWAK
jgi:hypothetical protein